MKKRESIELTNSFFDEFIPTSQPAVDTALVEPTNEAKVPDLIDQIRHLIRLVKELSSERDDRIATNKAIQSLTRTVAKLSREVRELREFIRGTGAEVAIKNRNVQASTTLVVASTTDQAQQYVVPASWDGNILHSPVSQRSVCKKCSGNFRVLDAEGQYAACECKPFWDLEEGRYREMCKSFIAARKKDRKEKAEQHKKWKK